MNAAAKPAGPKAAGVYTKPAGTHEDDLADQVEAIPAQDNITVKAGEIPLPPEELRDQLDNSHLAGAGPTPVDDDVEVATLDFFGDELPEWTHPLRFKFRWQGTPVESITVRQLTTHEIGKIYAAARMRKRTPDLFEFYAAMTGFPPPVLRALKAVDGDPITDKCWDFLPPSVRPAPA